MTQVGGENQAEDTEKSNNGIRPYGFQQCSLVVSPSGQWLPPLGAASNAGGTAAGPMKSGHLAHGGLSREACGPQAMGCGWFA